MYQVYRSELLDKKIEKHDNEVRQWIDALEIQLVNNPYTGDPLGVKWLREKKMKKWRTYFLVYEDIFSVYMVDISDKKRQQEVINIIKLLKNKLREELEQLKERRQLSADSSNTSLKDILYATKKTLFIFLAKVLKFFNLIGANCLHNFLDFFNIGRTQSRRFRSILL